MFNNHTITLIHDLRILGDQINNIDMLSIISLSPEYPQLPNIYDMTVLVPPTDMLMAWADGNQFVLANQYPMYLMQKEADDCIVGILAALTRKNIILYVPADEFAIFGPILLQHLYYMYGIRVNYGNSMFYIEPLKIPYIISKFYMMDLMEANEYLNAYPPNLLLPDWVINKLAMDLKPLNQPSTFEQYRQYFNNLNMQKINGQQKIVLTTYIGDNGGQQ